MRRVLSFVLAIFFFTAVMAQKNQMVSLTLHNGMNVLLCEDHGKAQIYGAVCVHVGSKNDPLDNTGMAHYFEHIMFKGTDKIGTLDWDSEKPCLDKISLLYDHLHTMTDEAERNAILLEINELSNEAARYAIPNEVDVILSKMGGVGVNASTGNDFTVYFNNFPSNQLEKWLLVYKERFRNPVFRLFQSELEAVYEEYNMYQDDPMSVFMEDALSAFYGSHPYGRPIIGYPEHLKNPQPSAMQKFFNTYYQPNNMTLILSGDFDAQGIVPLLEKTMGELRNEGEGATPSFVDHPVRMNTHLNLPTPTITGRQVVNVRETPIKMGVMGFKTVGDISKDAIYLDIIGSLLSNESQTGLLDRLSNEHKVMASYGFNFSMLEEGVFALFYVPKLIGQSHDEAETLLLAVVDSLCNGHIEDELFNAVKMDYLVGYLKDMESLEDKFEVMMDMVMTEQTPDDYYKEEELIRSLTKADIAAVARKYFGKDYMSFRSFMGHKTVAKLSKPAWKPITAENTDVSSAFAREVETVTVPSIKSQFIEFDKDVVTLPINKYYSLYSGRNPYNDIFTLAIQYNYGTLMDPALHEVVDYVSLQGSEKYGYSAFQLALQQLGATLDIYVNDAQTQIVISGFDKDLERVLALCAEKIHHPANDESRLKILCDDRVSSNKMMRNDAAQWGNALFDYVRYGQNSPYLMRPSLKEMKKWTGTELLQRFSKMLAYNGEVLYVGNRNPEEVVKMFDKVYPLSESPIENKKMVRKIRDFDSPSVFLASNKKFLQSNIYYYIPSKETERGIHSVCNMYNEYMGGSMAGVVFQEIRELRSLGYSAFAGFSYSKQNLRNGYLYGFLGTQADKTNEGCAAMVDLLVKFPERPEKFEMAKASLLQSNMADYIDFRSLPHAIITWKECGYKVDPREQFQQEYEVIDYQKLKVFHHEYVENNPLVITIAGDKKRMDVKSLTRYGKVTEVSLKEFFKE